MANANRNILNVFSNILLFSHALNILMSLSSKLLLFFLLLSSTSAFYTLHKNTQKYYKQVSSRFTWWNSFQAKILKEICVRCDIQCFGGEIRWLRYMYLIRWSKKIFITICSLLEDKYGAEMEKSKTKSLFVWWLKMWEKIILLQSDKWQSNIYL